MELTSMKRERMKRLKHFLKYLCYVRNKLVINTAGILITYYLLMETPYAESV